MLHATSYLINEYKKTIDTVCCIFPTAPLLKDEDLLRDITLLMRAGGLLFLLLQILVILYKDLLKKYFWRNNYVLS